MALVHKVSCKTVRDMSYHDTSTITYSAKENNKVVMSTRIRTNCNYKYDKQKIYMLKFIIKREITKDELLCFLAYVLNHIDNFRKNNSDAYILIRNSREMLKILEKCYVYLHYEPFMKYVNGNLVMHINNDMLEWALYRKLVNHCTLLLLTKIRYDPDLYAKNN